MGLKAQLAAGVTQAFAALDDIPLSIAYHKIVLGSYNVDTDSRSVTDVVVTVKGVMYQGKDIEQDSVRRLTSAQSKNTVTEDTYVIIPASDLPSYRPTLRDHMVIAGLKWEIFAMTPVPTDPCWIFHVRKV